MTFYNRDKFQIEFTDDILALTTGLGFIGQLLLKTNFDARFDSLKAPHGNQAHTHSAVLKAMIGLIAEGVVEFEEIDQHKDNPSFIYLLQSPFLPSKETLRQRLDNLAQFEVMHSRLYDVSQSAIQQFGTLTPLDSVSLKVHVTGRKTKVSHAIPLQKALMPLDIDVSPFDQSGSHKEGVSFTYKGTDGYSANFAYLSQEGFLVHSELRAGSTHIQTGTPAFLKTAIARSQALTPHPLCVRMDAGNDSKKNLAICQSMGVDYLIKRNIRNEPPQAFIDEAKALGAQPIPDAHQPDNVHYDYKTFHNGYPTAIRVYERLVDKDGHYLLFPEIEVEHYWSSLADSVDTLILLYHHHAICEQFHSELKRDLDAERLPSGKFKTNALILTLISLTYNLLRLTGQAYLDRDYALSRKKGIQRMRMKTILKRLIHFASKLVTSGRQTGLKSV